MTYWIVWNESKTEGFATTDAQLAYEVRNWRMTSNCFYADGKEALAGIAFAEAWMNDNCSIEQVGPDPVSVVKTPEHYGSDMEAATKQVLKLRMNSLYGKFGNTINIGCLECGQSECNGQCAGDDMMGASS